MDYHLYKLAPAGYHLTNLILHLLNCILVLWLIFIISKSRAVAFITAVLFAIHPLRVESVAWLGERKDTLYALFFLAALVSYCYYLKDKRMSKHYYAAIFLFLLSLMSKAMAVTLPLMLITIDYISGRKRDKFIFMDKIPFLILSLLFGIVAIFAQRLSKYGVYTSFLNLPNKFMTASYSAIFYLKKIFIPIHLSCLYPLPGKISFFSSLYPLAFVTILVFALRKWSRKPVFGWAFFLIGLLPVLQFIPIAGSTIVADRYTYIPSIGIFFMVGEGFIWLYKKSAVYAPALRAFLVASLIAIISVLALSSYNRCTLWKDDLSLWNNELLTYPGAHHLAYLKRGSAYKDEGKFSQAIADYSKAIEVSPRISLSYSMRAETYITMGKFDQAISDYSKAIEIGPCDGMMYFDRGVAYDIKGDLDNAIRDYTKAMEMNPRLGAGAYYNRGCVRYHRKDFDRAIYDYTEAIRIDPNFAKAYNDRAAAYLYKNAYADSWSDIQKVEKLGYEADPEILDKLKKASGRDR
ncbi:MAG: tetratricopeptide repeat protein [Candidatus Omnitrophota bacterium]|nr:tetratricopeptide repeat protein [Candidatus Omnitrophota bacterium]